MTDPAASAAALAQARRRDVEQRRTRVEQALAAMGLDGSEITISAVAVRARVHRSFLHRHPDLREAVLTAAAEAVTSPSPASTVISHRSVLAANANLTEHNRRLAQHVKDLEDRMSEILGQAAFARSGLGAPTGTAALQTELEEQRQFVLDLKKALAEREEELGSARETIRRLIHEANRART